MLQPGDRFEVDWNKEPTLADQAEAIECPFCGLRPASAWKAGVPPAQLVHPGYVACSCTNGRALNVREELLRREETSDAKRERQDILQVFREESQGRYNPKASAARAARSSRREAFSPLRAEQGWAGWADPDPSSTERLEGLTETLVANVPPWVRSALEDEARRLGSSVSRALRWAISQHLESLDLIRSLPRKKDKVKLVIKMTPSTRQRFRERCKELRRTNSDIITALVSLEFG